MSNFLKEVHGVPRGVAIASADLPLINLASGSAGGVTGILPIVNGGTNNSTAYTAGSVIFSNGTSLTQNNAAFFWDNTNLGLRIGTNLPLRTSAPEAISALLSLTSVPAALASAVNAKLLYTSASANTQSSKAGTFTVERSTSGSVTDTGGLQALSAQLNIDVPTGFTYTNTNGNPNAGLFIAALSLTSGGSYAANYVGIGVQADGTAVTGNKTGIFVGAVSGGTNNASIADNVAYTGNWFINQSGTNPSLLAGPLFETNTGLLSFGIGTTTGAQNGNEYASILYQPASSALSATTRGFTSVMNVTSNTANTSNYSATNGFVKRTTTGTVSDSGGIFGIEASLSILNGATSYTNTATNNSALRLVALTAAGTAPVMNYSGITFDNDTTTVTGYKNLINFGTVSGGTNNASIADNQAYTGNYFINQSGTNPSVLGGTHSSPNHINGYTTTATAAGTTTLTVGSTYQQFFTGTTTQTVTLPVVSGLVLGQSFVVTNNSTGIVTVQSSGANTVLAQAANTTVIYTCILTTGTTAASWNATIVGGTGLTSIPSAAISLSTTTAVSANTAIPYNSKISDNYNAYNTSTFTYTIPVTGQYRLSVWSPFSASAGTYWKRNGTTVSYLCDAAAASGTTSYPLTAGDTVTIYSDSSVTVTGGTGNFANFCIERVGN